MNLVIIPVILFSVSSVYCDDLKSLIVVYRHGARTPIDPYPNDPYKNESYWPVGFGQLTDAGIKGQFELGQWLRSRYSDFIPSVYSEKDIYVLSTDVDRTLMSAEANLAGLYQPKNSIIPNLLWRPIPVHTKPQLEDNLLAMKKPCQLYNKLYKKLDKQPFFRNLTHVYHDLYAYLSRYSGASIKVPDDVLFLYSVLKIEESFNFTLPEWTKKVFPGKMEYLAALAFAVDTFTPQMARLKTGPFFHHILEHFNNITAGQKERKIRVFSAHDTTIADILNSMKLFEWHLPPFHATILFELRQKNDSFYYVNLFYKNSSQPIALKLNGCEFNCDFNKFKEILKDLSLSSEDWENECAMYWFDFLPFGHQGNIIAVGSSLGFISFILCLICGANRMRDEKSENVNYSQLSSEEI